MSISPIISSPSYSNLAVRVEPVQSSSQQLPGSTARYIEDIVHLSEFAQLAHQGQSPSVIASTTGLSVNEVDSNLGISTTSSSHTLSVNA